MSVFLLGFAYRLFFAPDAEAVNTTQVETELSIERHLEILASQDLDKLYQHLVMLNDWPQQGELKEKIEAQRLRIETAERLLEFPLGETQRKVAIESNIMANTTMYGLHYFNSSTIDPVVIEHLNLGGRIRDAALPFVNDADQEIAIEARKAMLTVSVFDFTNSLRNRAVGDAERERRFERASKAVKSTLKRYPGNAPLMNHLGVNVRHLLGADKERGIKLAKALFQENLETKQEAAANLVQEIYDLAVMMELDYEENIENRKSELDTDNDSLLESTLLLVKDPYLGPGALDQVSSTIYWYEQAGEIEKCDLIIDALRDSVATLKNPESQKIAELISDNGRKRLEMAGKKFALNATSLRGVKIDNESLRDKIVVVLFVSGKNDNSLVALKALYRRIDYMTQQKIKPLVVCMSPDFDATFQAFFDLAIDLDFVDAEESGVAKQFPVNFSPHIMVLNHRHEVALLRVLLSQLKRELDVLEMELRKDVESR